MLAIIKTPAPIYPNYYTTNANPNAFGAGFNALTYGTYYVDAAAGNDSYDGSITTPWRTMSWANSNAFSGYTVYVNPGTYYAQITNGSIVWNLARGCVVTNSAATIDVLNNQYIVIRGEGDILSAGSAINIQSPNSGADIQSRLIIGTGGAFLVSTGSGRTRLKISNAQIVGTLYAETFDLEPEILLFGVSFLGSESGISAPFSVIGGVSTNNPISIYRTGSWIINTNLQFNPI